MIHFLLFYIPFYTISRWKFAHEESTSDVDRSISSLMLWPFTVELITISWLVFELYNHISGEKTSNEE